MKKWICFSLVSLHLFALPKGYKQIAGELQIVESAKELSIYAHSNRTIVDWNEFSFVQGEKGFFHLPDDKSAILHRITGSESSHINGSLFSNGKIYLINPNGIVIGKEGVIESSGFVASTLQIAEKSFLEGKEEKFAGPSTAKIVNLGKVHSNGDSISLFALSLENNGLIENRDGDVFLAAGSEIFLKSEKESIYIHPNKDAFISNQGEILAANVFLQASPNPYSLAIKQEGLIDATGVREEKGRIILSAEKGELQVSGTVCARKDDQGGEIQLLGKKVHLKKGSSIQADGIRNGGKILIGGDYQGNNPDILNADHTVIEKGTKISARSIEKGDGGKVVIWGEESALYFGEIDARGGEERGDGGFIEISSPKNLHFSGPVIATSIQGKNGTLLLDPSDITISNAASSPAFTPPTYNPAVASANLNAGEVQTALNSGTNVSVLTSAGVGGVGQVTILSGVDISWSTNATFSITADRNIIIRQGGGTVSLASTFSGANFTAMDFQANTAATATGDFRGILINTNTTISTVSGNINLAGFGGNTGVDSGIEMQGTSTISSTGTGASAGTITLNGTGAGVGGATLDNCRGVYLNGAGVRINSVDGDIFLTGSSNAGDNANVGIFITSGAQVLSTGSANITLDGTGATGDANNYGVNINSSASFVRTSGSGNITIMATGGSNGTNTTNRGFFINSSAQVNSTSTAAGAGTIDITAMAGAGTNGNEGIRVTGSSGTISSVNGDITISATGQGTGNSNRGTRIQGGATIISSGTGVNAAAITFTDSTGSAGASSDGMSLNGSSTLISSIDGDIDITCVGGNTGNIDHGLELTNSADIITTGTGNITIDGTGDGNNGNGIDLSNGQITCSGSGSIDLMGTSQSTDGNGIDLGNGQITSDTGDITLVGTVMGAAGAGVFFNNGQVVPTTSGNLSITGSGITDDGIDMNNSSDRIGAATSTGDFELIANTISLAGETAGTGNLTLRPISVASSIGIGTGAAGTFNLDGTEIATIQDGFALITFGAALATGTVDVQAVTINDPFVINGSTISINGAVTAGTNAATINVGPAAVGTFNLNALINTSGLVSINGGANNDTFNINVSGQTATLNGNGGTNDLNGPNVVNSWTVTGDDAGTLDNITFSNIQNLTGGTNNDTFTFVGASRITGAIDGNGGTNTLIGPNVVNSWMITANNAGTITPTGASGSTSFTDIQNLTGGTSSDTFTFNDGVSVTGTVNGGNASGNTLDLSAYTTTVTVDLAAGTATATGGFSNIQSFIAGNVAVDNSFTGLNASNSWNITADNTGTVNGISFTPFQNLFGGTSTDNFTFTGAFQISGVTGIDGNGGTNTITGPNVVNSWMITANNAGSISPTGASGSTSFTDIQNLTGGTSSDTFTFNDGVSVAGTVNGGNASGNTLDLSAYTTTVTVDLAAGTATATGDVTNIQSFIAGNVAVDNSFTGLNSSNSWNITADNTGTVNGISFTPFQNLFGGSSTDNFTFAGAFQISGATGIDGNGGTNTITGPNVNNSWAVTANNAGSISPTGASGSTSFTDIQNLTGGTANDTFALNDGVGVTGTINGGNAINNLLDLSAYSSNVTINIAGGTATGTGGITNLQQFLGGGATNTITGPFSNNTWTFIGVNSGTINGGTFTFAPFQNVNGGPLNDSFNFSSGFFITGLLNGSSGNNTLIAPNTANTWTLNADNAGSISTLSFTNIGSLTGGNDSDLFQFFNRAVFSGTINGGAPAANNTLDYTNFGGDVIILFETDTSGTASNILGGFLNIGNIIGNIIQLEAAMVNQLFAELSLATSTEVQHHRLTYEQSQLDYDQFTNLVTKPFTFNKIYKWSIANLKEKELDNLFEDFLHKIRYYNKL